MRQAMKEQLDNYKALGVPPCNFLMAVLRNDLAGAFAAADDDNAANMQSIVRYVYNEIPSSAWKSQKAIDDWIEHQGLSGISS